MDEFSAHKQAGAVIFRKAIEHIKQHGWNHNTMDILLAVSRGQVWQQPMAVLMFSELSNELDSRTLTQFDKQTHNVQEVIDLLTRVATALEHN